MEPSPSGTSPKVEASRVPCPQLTQGPTLSAHLAALHLCLLHLLDVHQVLCDLLLLSLCGGRGLRGARAAEEVITLLKVSFLSQRNQIISFLNCLISPSHSLAV